MKVYRNKRGELHRLDGPAVKDELGSKFWYMNGKYHREDGPAVECWYGTKHWYINGEYIDSYFTNPCFTPKTRQEALDRLKRKERPHSYDLYMADINERFPE